MKGLKKLFIMQWKENKEVEHIREKGSWGVADSRLKKTGWFGTVSATNFYIPNKQTGSPVAERQKGGPYDDIKRIKETSSCSR